MAGTIIDELVVRLGLDAEGVKKGQKEASDHLRKTREDADLTGKQMAEAGKVASEFYTRLRNEVLAFTAALLGANGVKEFASKITAADAAIGRFSANIGSSVRDVGTWGNALELVGGRAEDMTAFIGHLSDEIQNFMIGGGTSLASPLGQLSKYGLDYNKFMDHTTSMTDRLNMLREAVGKLQQVDPAAARKIMQMMGGPESFLGLSKLDPSKWADTWREALTNSPTDKMAKSAIELENAWAHLQQTIKGFGREVWSEVNPALTKAVELMAKWVDKNKDWAGSGITAAINTFCEALKSVPWDKIKEFYDRASEFYRNSMDWVDRKFGLPQAGAGEDAEVDRWRAEHGMPPTASRGPTQPAPRAQPQSSPVVPPVSQMRETFMGRGRVYAGAEADVGHLMSRGWTREQAAGIVANIQGESGGRINGGGDGGLAYGLAQWHPDRQADFAAWAGHDIRSSTRAEQLDFIDYELRRGKERAAGQALMRARTAEEATEVVVKRYERPLNQMSDLMKRLPAAKRLMEGGAPAPLAIDPLDTFGAGPGATYAPASPVTNNSHSAETHIGEVHVHTQATDAHGIGRDISTAIRRASNARQADMGMA